MSRMTKKSLVVALALTAMALVSTAGSAQSCTGTPSFQFVGGGSSAQFNSFAFGALYLANGNSLVTSGYNLWSSKSATLIDTRPADQPTDTGAKVWIVWDNNTNCNVWVNFSVDSTVGVKNFFAYQKKTVNGVSNALIGAVYATTLGTGGQNLIPGFPDSTASLPTAINTVLTRQAGPTASSGSGSLPQPMCGQLYTTPGGNNHYCYFNAGLTDIRPEDALYATTRALSTYNTTNSLVGLGYNQTACGATGTGTQEGCPIYDSLAQSSKFNVLTFALSGNDPFTGGGAVPQYSTLNTGIAPLVVFVANADTATGGFGNKSGSNYVYNDINHKVLGLIYEGTLHCTSDVGTGLGVTGKPITAVVREPLSGTYNAFEFTAIRTLSGSASTAIGENKISSTTWFSDDASGQELDNNPATNFGVGTCPGNSNSAPTGACGDPMYVVTPSHPGVSASGSGCGAGLRVRAIGTGEEVKAVRGGYTLPYSVSDALGYAFWSYQNFSGLVSKSNCTTQSNGNAICTGSTGHYLTVDGVDPFTPEPGATSLTPGTTAYELPQCAAIVGVSGATFPCAQIPFTHELDGGYPLWSLLRTVTFENIIQNTNIGGCTTPPCPTQQTPAGVTNLVAAAEINATNNSYNLSDFQPFLSNLVQDTGSNCPTYNAQVNPNPICYKGNLALGVFRSHYVQSKINPNNGHAACHDVFTGVYLNGNTYNSTTKATTNSCLIDAGGDMGGSVFTVQADVDFNLDFGGLYLSGAYEIYGLRQ